MDDTTTTNALNEIAREVEYLIATTRAQTPERWATVNAKSEGWRIQLIQTWLLLKLYQQEAAHIAYVREREAECDARRDTQLAQDAAWKEEVRAQHREALERSAIAAQAHLDTYAQIEERKLALQQNFLDVERTFIRKQGKAITEILERVIREHVERLFAAGDTQALPAEASPFPLVDSQGNEVKL